MSKVYIILESSGSYEDYREYIHSIYLDSDKAESVKVELESAMELYMEQAKKCNACNCGYGRFDEDKCRGCEIDGIDCLKCQMKQVKKYCDKSNLSINEEELELECEARIRAWEDERCHYRIEEKEVIE